MFKEAALEEMFIRKADAKSIKKLQEKIEVSNQAGGPLRFFVLSSQ
jgi:hypothetical protein